MTEENREFIRLPFDSVLDIQIAGKTSWAEGTCSNMSAGGVLVTTSLPIAIDTRVTVQLKKEPHKFKAQGQVIRLVESDDGFLVAIKYSEDTH